MNFITGCKSVFPEKVTYHVSNDSVGLSSQPGKFNSDLSLVAYKNTLTFFCAGNQCAGIKVSPTPPPPCDPDGKICHLKLEFAFINKRSYVYIKNNLIKSNIIYIDPAFINLFVEFTERLSFTADEYSK